MSFFALSHFRLLLLVALLLPAPAVAQTTALLLQSEPGDYVGGGSTRVLTDTTAAFTATRNFRNGISVQVFDGLITTWNLQFSLPNDVTLSPGHYTGATIYPSTPFVGMYVSSSLFGCVAVTGRYLVREVAYGSAGNVIRFAADVEQHCNDAAPALFAALRFNSTVPLDLFPGDSARYSVTMSTTPGGLVTGGGLACGAGQTACATTFTSPTTVTLLATPLNGYLFNGWGGGCSGSPSTTLVVNTIKECRASFTPVVPSQPRTRLTFTSAPGDPVGQGIEHVYSFVNSQWTVQTFVNGLTFRLETTGPLSDAVWSLQFRAPFGQSLVPGRYTGAVRAPFSITTPGLELFGDGRGCNTLAGEFTVHQYDRDPTNGSVLAFAADFSQRCEEFSGPPLTGRVEYWATYQMGTSCSTPDPFVALGGGICQDGGWLPAGLATPVTPPTPPPPTPPSPSTCTGADPFTSIGGGRCENGGWVPGATPAPTPPPSTPPPTQPPTLPAGCTIPDPFVAMGGGTCVNGGWLPPGISGPGGTTPPPPTPPVPPAPSSSTCATPDPFAAMGGGTCYAGGWLPPGMPIPGGGGG